MGSPVFSDIMESLSGLNETEGSIFALVLRTFGGEIVQKFPLQPC